MVHYVKHFLWIINTLIGANIQCGSTAGEVLLTKCASLQCYNNSWLAGRCSHYLIVLIFFFFFNILQVKTMSLWRIFLFSWLDVTVFQHWASLQSQALSSLTIPDFHRWILVKIFFTFQFMQTTLLSNLIWTLPYAIHQVLEEREL